MNHDVLVTFTSIDLPNQRVGCRQQPSSGILGLIVHMKEQQSQKGKTKERKGNNAKQNLKAWSLSRMSKE